MPRIPFHPKTLLLAVRKVFVAVVGRWSWEAPGWAAAIGRQAARGGRYAKANPKRTAGLAVVLVAAVTGYAWYATRPKPHYVTFVVNDPGLTEYNENGISKIKPLTVTFKEAAAPLKQIQNVVTSGIDLSPAIAGTWVWTTDHDLRFTPKADWPVDGAFSVKFAKTTFARQVRVDRYTFKFRSQPFSARISDSQFYQDPRDPNLKKLVATVTFSHPVDVTEFESHVSLIAASDAEYLGLTSDSRHFTVIYDKFKLAAHIHSSPLTMPRDDTPMTLRVDKGVRAARGGNDTPAKLEAVVVVPGRTSLRFSDARMTVVDNARYEPEQILFFKSSSPVVERAFAGKVSVQLLPERGPDQPKEDPDPYDWSEAGEIGTDILTKSSPVTVDYVPSEEGGDTSHGFKFNAPVGRYLYVMVKDGIEGTGGYLAGKPYIATLRVAPYPRALTFLGQGALLPLGGDKKVGFLVRGIDKIQVEIGRVLPNQLQHLAPEMADFSRPSVYDELEDRLVERSVSVRSYARVQPGKPTYDSIDLGQYLQDHVQARRGLFLLHVKATGPKRQSDDESDDDEGDSGDRHGVSDDTRLILVTDLGFIVKQAKDGGRDVFVQSIRSGLPVAGARVSLSGSNGQPVLASTTDATGRAQLAAPPRDAVRERTPQMVMVERDDDVSFMPLRSNGRDLDLSRFDTGGVQNAKSAQQVSAYLFSDRGIYRPGETAHLGVIARTADWKASLAGLPIDIDVTDARGLLVNRSQLSLSAGGFDEVAFASQAASPTGTYEAAAYLTKDQKRRELLGSTSFKVQEFEPDRMKVQLELSAAPVVGWLRPDDVKAKITVAQLFGEPAGGRRVEGELSLTPALPRFARYDDYRFQIGEALKEPFHEALAALTTDDKGMAEFNLDLKRFTASAYRLSVLTRAYEAEGGRNVAAQNSVIVSNSAFLVGVKPDGDLSYVRRTSARAVRWLAVNQQLNPVAADNLTLEWVQRKYVSVLTQQNNHIFKYVSRLREIVRNSRGVKIASGGSSFPLPTDEPGDFVLVLRDASGTSLNTVAYSVAGQANLSRSLDRNAELQIQLDKPAYLGGDTVEVSIRAPYVGAGLITIERERVFRYQWFKTTTTSSVQRITLPDDFEGNGYVSVQFVRDPASDELFMSPLSYGVAPFSANLAARTQSLKLETPGRVKPGATLTMKLTASEASRAVVLAVDEGILQVARYKNPDPLGYFFQKRMLEVETTQILDLILPDFKRFIALAAAGGDADGGFARQLNPFNKKRKAPVAYWSGVVDVGPEGRTLTYTVPDYFNGKLRIVAIGASGHRVGVTEAATEVRGDFILTPNVPATVGPGDTFVVSVGVFNNTTGSTAPIQLSVKPGAGLSLVGDPSASLQIPDLKEGVAEFRVKANSTLGPNALTFSARRGTAEAHVEESIGVRPAVAFRTQLTLGRVDGGSATVPLTRNLYSEQRKVEAAVSTIPMVWGQGLIAYLDHYEYSCTEQLVSKGIAALILTSRPELGVIRSRTDDPLLVTYSTVRGRMNDEGGLGLWSSTPQTSDFSTVYAAHFLVEARDRGQKIPQDTLTSLDNWLTRFASTPASTLADARLRAYAVYVLARQGIRVTAALSNVEQELTKRYARTWQTDLAAAYLASTYRLMQRNDDADRIVKSVPWSTQKKDFADDTYYDAVVHDAQLLYLLSRHFPARLGTTPPAALETISKAVSGNQASSLSAAYTILALDAFAKTSATTTVLGVSEIGKDGKENALTLPEGAIRKADISEAAAKVQFARRGTALAYYVLNESGFDRDAPTAEISKGVEIIRDFIDAKGNPISRVAVGDEFFVRLRVRATDRDRQPQIAIVDVLPGGVEPVLELQAQSDSSAPSDDPAMARQRHVSGGLPVGIPGRSDWTPSHIDVREDRVILYGDAGKTAGTFVYRVRADNIGTYQVPPAFAEGMYNRAVVGQSRGASLEVVKP